MLCKLIACASNLGSTTVSNANCAKYSTMAAVMRRIGERSPISSHLTGENMFNYYSLKMFVKQGIIKWLFVIIIAWEKECALSV